jgi:hypothetical protein
MEHARHGWICYAANKLALDSSEKKYCKTANIIQIQSAKLLINMKMSIEIKKFYKIRQK